MIRRARLSLKPNVRPGGRASGSTIRDGGEGEPAGGSSKPEEADNCPGGTSCTPNAGAPDDSAPERPENVSTDCTENLPSTPASAPLQRRKRISTLPNLAKPRVSSSAAVTPSQKRSQVEAPPTLPVPSIPSLDVASPPETAKVVTFAKPQSPAAVSQHVPLPEKRTPVPQVPQFSPHKKMSIKQSEVSSVKSVDCKKGEFTPLKERPPQKSSLSEELKKGKPKKLVAAGYLEKERIQRAKKLRELLRDELRKERKIWKAKHPVIMNEEELERSKMTMRDFIYFIPPNNPMTSSFEEPKTPEKTLTDSQVTGPLVKNIINDDEDEIEGEEEESQLLAPRVKVAEDGSIILDEESLTVEVSRGKAPIVEGNDPIFERGSTTTYSSFRKNNYSKPWSEDETNMFFMAISMVGTDFSMIGQLFPHRERIEIKNKFKREERVNCWRIDKAFREKQTFDFEFFAKRLEKALEKKQKTSRVRKPREKKATKPSKKKNEKTATEQILSDGESAILSDGEGDDVIIDEKENEHSSVTDCLVPSDKVPRKKRKAKKKNELEDENQKSQDEETNQVPQKETKSRKKDKAAAQSKDCSELEKHSPADVQADAVPEKKKKTKKSRKKSELESEDNGNATNSVMPDDADSISHIYSEAEPGDPSQLSQSEALPCEEGPSLLIFNEESGCLSGLSGLDLSSLQECLSEVPVTQSSLIVPSNSLDYDDDEHYNDVGNDCDGDLVEICPKESSLETSRHAIYDCANHMEEDIVMDGQTEKAITNEETTKSEDEQKTVSVEPIPLTRRGFQKPEPNIPVKPMGRQEKVTVTEEENRFAAGDDTSLFQSPKEDLAISENFNSDRSASCSIDEDPVCTSTPLPVQQDYSTELSQLRVGESQTLPQDSDTSKEDMDKDRPSRPVRGRLVRPKPNLTKVSGKNKPSAPEPDTQTPNSQDSGQLVKVPCNVVLSSSYAPVNETETLVTAKDKPSGGLQDDDCTKCSLKPAPLRRGRFQRPKPNVMSLSRKEMSDDKRDSPEGCAGVSDGVTPEDTKSKLSDDVQKNANSGNHVKQDDEISEHKVKQSDCASIDKDPIPESLGSAQDVITGMELIPTVSSGTKSSAWSQHDGKKSPIKPAPLVRGRLQRPKPNLIKPALNNKVISDVRRENDGDITSRETVLREGSGTSTKDNLYELAHLGSQDFKMSTNVDPQLNSAAVQEVIAETSPPTVNLVNEDSSLHEPGKKKSNKSLPQTQGQLQRPQPNLQNPSACTEKTEARGVEMGGKNKTTAESELSSDSEADPSLLGKSSDLEKKVPSSEESYEYQETCMVSGKTNSASPKDIKNHVSLTEEPPKPAVRTQVRFKASKPNLSPPLAENNKFSASDGSRIESEGEIHEESTPKPSAVHLSKYDEDISLVCANTAFPKQTVSCVLPLETIGLASEDQTEKEESFSRNKELIASDAEKRAEPPKSAVTRNRFQRAKPNLSRSLARPSLSSPENVGFHDEKTVLEDSIDTSSTENNDSSGKKLKEDLSHLATDVELSKAEDSCSQLGTELTQLEETTCSEEPTKGSSVKPLRNRFQKPKPNLGRASARKDLTTVESKASMQEKGQMELSSKTPEITERKVTTIKNTEGSNVEKAAHVTLKPALLRCSRLARPVPNLVNAPSKKPSPTQSKTSDEEAASPTAKAHVSSGSSGRKRKSFDCLTVISSKISRPDESEKTSSSESELEGSLSSKELRDDNCLSSAADDNKHQLSRFGRLLKKPTPASSKASVKSSEQSEKEKPTRSVKPTKNKIVKPVSKAVKPGKTALVKLRATQQDDDDELEDSELDFEEEDFDLAPEKLNQAPVFVPFSLRSPKPVPAEIEETVEEFEIPVEDVAASSYMDQNLVKSPQHLPASQNEESKELLKKLEATTVSDQSISSAEGKTTETRTVEGGLGFTGLQAEEEASESTEIFLQTSEQSSPVVVVDQLHSSSIEDEIQKQNLTCQDVHVSESVLQNGDSAEEATFILTLVEIPIGDDYSYSCDMTSADALPAPVLITSNSTDVMTVHQNESTESTVMAPSYELPPPVHEQTDLLSYQSFRKRSASGLSEENCMQLSKKSLVCSSVKQEDDSQPKSTGVEQNDDVRLTAAVLKTEETKEACESSVDNRFPPIEGEKLLECTAISSKPEIDGCSPQPEAASLCSLKRDLPSAITNASSASETSLQSPGRKPLGFFSLVCKDKSKTKKKNLCKRSFTKAPSCIQTMKEQVSAEDHEHCISSEVPSELSSCVVMSALPSQADMPSASQDSDDQDTVPAESPKPHDLATEEDAAQVSQFFFSDIFMEVDH